MPIYEYVCQSCGAEVEVLHGLNAPGPQACDVCGGPMRKRLAAPAIVFRGSGWAKKERRDAARATAAPGDGKSKADAGGGGGGDDATKGSGGEKGARESKPADTGSTTAGPAKEATGG